ncbi:MAG: Crp/Fnr family transcriptional regulator [Thermodesulfovibrionales bacterium]
MLEKIEVLKNLRQEDLKFLEMKMKTEKYKKGEDIFYENSKADWFHVLFEGRVKISKIHPDGKEVTLEIVDPPDFFGALAILRNIPYPATSRAMENSLIGKIPASSFFSVAKKYPDMEKEILNHVTMRLKAGMDALRSILLDDVTKRVIFQLMRLAKRYGKKSDEGILVELKLTREDIAELAGTTVETAIRVMSRLKKEGFIEERERKILIKKMPNSEL